MAASVGKRHAEKVADDERMPLITTVYVNARRPRRGCNIARRFCTVACGSSILALIFFCLVPIALLPRHVHHRPHFPHEPPVDVKSPVSFSKLQQILLTTPSGEKAAEWSKYYTAGPHLAGKNYSQALWTKEKWQEFGIENTDIVAYDTYINYPIGHRLALYEKPSGKDADAEDVATWKLQYEASLEEDVLEEDSTTGLPNRVPTFHGYSASGNVTAPFVYVNYGTYQDFDDLLKANVSLAGKIAIVKYGAIFRGLKVKRAQDLGMVGVIIYSDPGDDEGTTEENGDALYPDGPARNPSSVQRGSTQFLSVAPGDPTTPGYPSKPGVPRQPVDGAIPSIPSIPISYVDALPILKALNGRGPRAKNLNKYWDRNNGLEYKGVEYYVGPSPDNVVLNLVNEQEYVTTPLWNVIGIINGTNPHEVIVVGNHRDAWIAGGAVDPNSGSAALNEVIRGFGKAVELGWKPLRTIVFASWDGEEYGLIGSTEWVEEYLPWLSATNVAYVNMDVGFSGKHFEASANPLLNNIVYDVTSKVLSPNQTVKGQTVRDTWDGYISTMGSGSDFTAFQDFAGIPSIDIGFTGGEGDPVYHYHSNYDSFYWISTFGDPGFHYHAAAAKILGLFTARLAESPVIPLNTTDYAIGLKSYLGQVESKIQSVSLNQLSDDDEQEARFRPTAGPATGSLESLAHSFKRLDKAADHLYAVAFDFDANAAFLAEEFERELPWWKWPLKLKVYLAIIKSNTKVKYLDRKFIYSKGLESRNWFKHVVFAPGLWTGYSGGKCPS